MHLLDRPIWSALKSRQAEFSRGTQSALAFRPDVEPFAAAESDKPCDIAALGALWVPNDFLLLIQTIPSPTPPGLRIAHEAVGLQMIASAPIEPNIPVEAAPLGDDDVPDMQELAELTKPGPFRTATHKLGQFWGIRRNGRLVAMAGERLKLEGYTEVSGVCSHPDWRGHGLAASLSALVSRRIQDRGETSFLHVYASNDRAISLYQALGFEVRSKMAVQAFTQGSE